MVGRTVLCAPLRDARRAGDYAPYLAGHGMGEGDRIDGRDEVGEEIRRDTDIGVADDKKVVLRLALQFHQLGNLGIHAGRRAADDELGVAIRELLQELADDAANGVIGRGDAEQDLRGTGILLREPASQAIRRRRVAAFEGFEQGDRRLRVEG